ncbi:hypothetical protein ECE50_029405 [Chitinophaga sp. Mgbs1]|uniref:Uncharacterized protein n=1 Tax=Chitinophaga solisilvae TaxID=1233460 RepID=A0A433WPX2_9BACT|nr:hypothetical protein [Chitinophaga solisilvae]
MAQYHQRQVVAINDFQYGVAGKAIMELKRREPHLRLSVSTGIGCPVAGNGLYPALNMEWQIYYGGLGTKSGSQQKDLFSSDIIWSAMLTAGTGYSRNPDYVPLYYFTDLSQPPLINPYQGVSASVGVNAVLAMDRGKSRWQRIAYVNAHWRYVQLGYYNDGGALLKYWGDKADRYYTGGGFLAVTIPEQNTINTFTASYHKFTGYTGCAFEITNEINGANVYYRKVEQQYYNRSYWNVSVGSARYGVSAFYQYNNPIHRWDFQNFIHYIGNFGYHQIPYPQYQSFGLTYFNSFHQISKP